MGSGIIHILTIESHDIIKHMLGLDSRTVRVKRNSLDIAVDGLVPLAPFAVLNMTGDRDLSHFTRYSLIIFRAHIRKAVPRLL